VLKEENIFLKRKKACSRLTWSEIEIGSGSEMFMEFSEEKKE
jgi:hypothetical protein